MAPCGSSGVVPGGRSLCPVVARRSSEIPASRIVVRISPSSSWMDIFDPDKRSLYSALVRSLSG